MTIKRVTEMTGTLRTARRHRLPMMAVGISICIFILTTGAGCSCDNTDAGSIGSSAGSVGSSDGSSEDHTETANSASSGGEIPDTGSQENSGDADNNEGSEGMLTRIDREIETYDYEGWDISTPAPDVYFLADKFWIWTNNEDFENTLSGLLYYDSWVATEGSESEIVYRQALNNITSPMDKVIEQANAIAEGGGEVEWGALESVHMVDAYYYRVVSAPNSTYIGEEENWNVQIYYTNGGNESMGSLNNKSLSFKASNPADSGVPAIVEDDFWKMANSYFSGNPVTYPEDYYRELTGQEHGVMKVVEVKNYTNPPETA